jgi:hypothetical protein
MKKITKNTYLDYKKVYQLFWNVVDEKQLVALNSPIHPFNVLKSFEEKSPNKIAIQSLKIGMNDCMRMLKDMSNESKQKLDQRLQKANLCTLNQLVFYYKRIDQKIVKRGSIKNDEEYRMVIEILNDLSSEIDDLERKKLNQLIIEFESS